MKYKKLQQGGLLIYQPTIVPTQSVPIAPSMAIGTTGAKNSILDDDVIKQLSGVSGLTNDTNALISQVAQLESKSQNPYLARDNRKQALAIIGKINELKQNRAMWEQSYNIAKESGGLGEIAVGGSGELYVKDKEGNIQAITPEEYKKNVGKFKAMSVAELLEERNSNPNLTGKNEIFNIANNSIGIEKISDYAKSIVSSLGKETKIASQIYDKEALSNALDRSSKDIQLTGRKATPEELQGMAILDTIRNSPSKYNEITTEASTEKNNALKAAKYIWSTLGTDAQNKLSVQAYLNDTNPINLLVDLIVSDSEEFNKVSVKGLKSTAAGSGSGSGASGSLAHSSHLGNLEQLITGTLATGRTMALNDPDYGAKFEGMVFGEMPLLTTEGKTIGPTIFENVVKQGGYERYVDTNNMYFGNTRIEPWNRKNIALDGTGNLSHVLLPVDSQGKPNFGALQQYRELMDVYNNNKDNMSPSEIQKMFNEKGFNVTVDNNKNIKVAMNGNVKPFLVTQGYTTAAVNDIVEDNTDFNSGGLKRLNDSESHNIKPLLDQAWTIIEGKKTKNIEPKSFFKQDHLYKGLIFMPLRDNASNRVKSDFGHGPLDLPYTEEDVMYHNQNTSGTNFVPSTIEDMEDYYEW